jgi:type I restriction enzyme M protein
MNADTKRHIDAARQVLVGVVPNPTSQIDQITNALIYKFMDDMDQSAIRAGGDPSFFVGDLEVYAWTRLMDPRMGNQERMNLYSEALTRFSQAKQLPELFRGIFKSAFLPYRSPETLGLFLKEIDYFDYSHPEELGNAYEYLLSIMSSQGDAGQFRTPRHIIDFIVDVVNPTKEDKVLDPACGTGGFLVSSYRHILEQHDGLEDPEKRERPLTPDERRKIMGNFEGYDIDPTMVRIAQVNMYLHQFKNPKIVQYDSLSSEERWNDKFDVILANPPFMSPKGGIKPHSKFSIESSRSEVLFVDYIMNHLRPKGRAGIIVPEGIIFQSGKSHKELRKNLVNDGLYAVVSLPSGVFAPYSGVKTSILLFNNELAKISTEILFVKIIHDGTDLGAKKRITDANDLVPATELIKQVGKGQFKDSKIAHAVSKKIIIDSGDYNLSGDRYKISAEVQSEFELVELGDLVEEQSERIKDTKNIEVWSVSNKDGFVLSSEYFDKQVASADISNYKIVKPDYFAYNPSRVNVGSLAFNKTSKTGAVSPMYAVFSIKETAGLSADYLFSLLKSEKLNEFILQLAQGAVRQQLRINDLKIIKIPLPPLEIQEQIVAELDGYASIIAGAKQITNNWKPKIDIDPEWESKLVSEIAKLEYGIGEAAKDSGEYRYVRITDIGENGELKNTDKKYINETVESKKYLLKRGDVLVARTGATFGKTMYFDEDEESAFAGFLIRLNFDENQILSKYFWCFAQSDDYWEQAKSLMTGGGQPQFNANAVGKIIIPLPPLDIQKQIVEKIEAERALVESSKKLIEIYDQKTKETIAKLWSE